MSDSFASLLAARAGKLALALAFAAPAVAISFKSAPSPHLNIADLGRIAFAGDFDSISLYQYEGQSEQASGRTGALLSRYPNGVFAPTNQTDADIQAMCSIQTGGAERIVFAGNFTSVGNIATPGGIALLNPTDGTVKPMYGLTGSVNTLYCDRDAGEVYVGGFFTGSDSSNAIIWKDDWKDLSFEGFNGAVHSIAKSSNGNIIFGGEFNGLGGNATSVAAENNTQIIPISKANISAQTSSGLPGFTQPSDITCKNDFSAQGSDQTWLLADTAPGFWKAEFGFGFSPSSLRLWNTDFEGRGTKTFRFTALPDGGILNLTYTDPSTGNKAFCDSRCPLPEGNTTAQDFTFVNVVGMNAFRIDISDWYGNGAGLNGIQLFQNDMYSYAVDDFNEPANCGTASSARSEATSTGPWQNTPSHSSNSQYLTAVLEGNPIDTEEATVTFFPSIKQSGNYSVTIFTPGCQGDGTCGSRGRVNVTAKMSADQEDPGTILWQTNNFDKYDEVYNGYIDATKGFRPQVVLRPAPGQGPTPLTVVAQRVRFTLLKATSGDLNGVFEYTPGQNLDDVDFSASVINAAGASLSPREKAIILSVTTDDKDLYVAGNFSTDDGRNNIFTVREGDTKPSALTGNGLNRQVMTLFQNGSTLYVGGNFTNTEDGKSQGLNMVAAYTDKQWRPLGAGVNGVVMYLVPFSLNVTAGTPEQVLAVSGFFNQVLPFGNNPAHDVDGLAIWVPSQNNWLNNIKSTTFSISGRLMAYADVPDSDRWFGGSVSSGFLGASGAAELHNEEDALSLRTFPIDIQAQKQSAPTRKRAITEGEDLTTTGVRTGTFYKENGMNRTILAGHFATTGSDDQNITNVLIIDGNDSDKVAGFGEQLDANSTFVAVAVLDDVLYAGGAVSGQLDGDVAGIVAYDLATNKFRSVQPPPLQGINVTVNSIAARPKSKDVFIGGRFESAGALTCSAVCIWNTDRNQWTSPANGLAGVANALIWTSDTTLLIAGNLTSGNNQTMILSYDSSSSQFSVVPGASELPGPVTALTIATNDGTELWASGRSSDGTTYLQRFNGDRWLPVDGALFGQGTEIRGIQVLSLSENHDQSDLIDEGQDLLLMGQINITDFGTASGALFNGSALIPFLLATTADNTAGSLSSVFVENPNFFFRQRRKQLALGFIVLIALAIALSLTFLLVVIGIIIEWYRKKAQGYSPAPQSYPDRLGNVGRLPPEQLFGTLSGPRAPTI